MAAIHFIADEALKARVDAEARRQKRSIKAVVEIALERYFADLDRERALAELDRSEDRKAS